MGESPSPTDGLTSLGVVGAGLMGSGIAQIAAQAGLAVCVYDTDSESLRRVTARIAGQLDRLLAKQRITAEERDGALARIVIASDLEQIAGCDAVIEAVVERLEVKREVFERLGSFAGPDTILATNTSALSITAIAATSPRPESVVGMHFFSPVPVMQLCEIVRGYSTSDETLARAIALSAKLGKEHIVVNRDEAGFVTSRIMVTLINEAAKIVESGLASAEDVDKACRLGFGHRMGPLATADLAGLDVSVRAAIAVLQGSRNPAYAPAQILERMVDAGRLGRKSGAGFYDYAEGGIRA